MRDKLFIVIAGIVLLLAGCSKPEYLIEGLTLPPGSTVVTKTNTTGSPGDMGMGMPMGAVDNGVTVVFNCGSDWGSIVSHFNSHLQPLGYTDSMSNLGGMEKEFADAMPEGYLDSMKMWMSSDLKSAVTLVNGKAMAESAGMANAPTGADGFSLTVIQMK